MQMHYRDYIIRGNINRIMEKLGELADGADWNEKEDIKQHAEFCLRDLAPGENRASKTASQNNDAQTNRRGPRNHQRGRRQYRNKAEA